MSDKYPGGFVTTGAPAGYSVAFNGSTDYLTCAVAASPTGTQNFTVEGWIYVPSTTTEYAILDNNNSSGGFYLRVNTSGQINVVHTNIAGVLTSTTSIKANAWNYFCVTRSGNTFNIYLNSTSVDATTSNSVSFSTGSSTVIGAYYNGALNFNGYMSNLRVIIGSAIAPTVLPTQFFPVSGTTLLTCQSPTFVDNSTNNYTLTPTGTPKVSNFTPFAGYTGFNPALGSAAGGVWTLDEAAYYQNNRQWPIYDPYFNQTTLMLHGNGTNGAQNNTFLDSSTNNFTVTRNGNTTQGTFTPFSQTGWSYNGTAGAYCQLNNADYSLGTGDFTVETWMYCVDDSTYPATNICSAPSNPNFTVGFGNGTAGARQLYVEYGGGAITGIGSSMSGYLNKWTHIAVVRQSGIVTAYQNGVSLGSVSKAAAVGSTANLYLLRNSGDTGQDFRGYISNYRITKAAVYTSNFTPSTVPFTAIANTVLLTFQSNRFVDNSANNSTVTPAGTASIQAFSPFVPAITTPTTYSNYFDGSGDYLTLAANSAFNFNSGDFTLETWVNMSTFSAFQEIFSQGSSNFQGIGVYVTTAGKVNLDLGNGSSWYASYLTTGTISLNSWTHIAIVRQSTTYTIYLNGISSVTGTNATFPTDASASSSYIGVYGPLTSQPFIGFMSNYRFIKGTAVYTANFTPPNAPFPTNTTNQQLLTCQASTLIDSNTATTAKTITANGNVKPVSSPTPFAPVVDQTTLNTAYSTSLIGGSAYFDGSGDFLQLADSTSWDLTGDYTIEMWIYPTATPVSTTFFQIGDTSSYLIIYLASATKYITIAGSLSITTSTALALNTWNHVALVRSGSSTNNTVLYLNGVNVGQATNNTSFAGTASNGVRIGAEYPSNYYFNGYISSTRLVKGTALYTSAFVPPTAPPTPITNTQLLLNYTNAGIIDNTAKNVLETVGNAQISTTQSKYGGSSMYFDGTGDWLLAPSTPNVGLGTGNFTFETWIYPTTNPANGPGTIIDARNSATSEGWVVRVFNDLSVGFYDGPANTYQQTTANAVSLNTWAHIACVRFGTTLTIFVNGVALKTSTVSSNLGTTWPFYIGNNYTAGYTYYGYIDDLRITKGVARYLTNFTPPTSQLQDQ